MLNFLIRFFKANYPIIITFSVFILLELPFLDTSRPVMVDETWYSNPSYNFTVLHTFSNTNVGFGGNGAIVYSLYLSAYFYLFGISLFTARLSSFILGLISILLFSKMLKTIAISEFNRFLSLSFFIFANLYLSIFKLARPEALAFTFSLCLLIILYYYLKDNYSIKYLLLLILFTFLAVNTHPNSSIIILLTIIVIIYFVIKNKEYKKLWHIILLGLTFIGSSIFILFILSLNNNFSFNESLSIILDRSSAGSSFWKEVAAKISVTLDYFILSNRIITFLPQILIIFTGLFFVKKNRLLFFVSLCGVISMSLAFLLLTSVGFIYIYIYILIFSVLSVALILQTIVERKIFSVVTDILIIAVIAFNIIAYVVLTKKAYDPEINITKREISSLLPQNSTIISGPAFWFISPEKDIKSWEYFKDINEFKKNKYFYIINCDKFNNEDINDKNSIIQFKLFNDNYNADTLLSKYSKIYGNIYLIKFTGE